VLTTIGILPTTRRRIQMASTSISMLLRLLQTSHQKMTAGASVVLLSKPKKKGQNGVLIEEPVPEPEPAPAPEPEKKEGDDLWSSTFGGATKEKKRKKKKKRGALVEEPPPPLPELEALPEREPVPEPEPVKEEDPWDFAGNSPGKKGKKKKEKEEPKVEELPPTPAEPEPEPEPEPTPPEPEPELVKEERAVDPFAGLSKSQKNKLQDKMKSGLI
jgi:hypothetical protein